MNSYLLFKQQTNNKQTNIGQSRQTNTINTMTTTRDSTLKYDY